MAIECRIDELDDRVGEALVAVVQQTADMSQRSFVRLQPRLYFGSFLAGLVAALFTCTCRRLRWCGVWCGVGRAVRIIGDLLGAFCGLSGLVRAAVGAVDSLTRATRGLAAVDSLTRATRGPAAVIFAAGVVVSLTRATRGLAAVGVLAAAAIGMSDGLLRAARGLAFVVALSGLGRRLSRGSRWALLCSVRAALVVCDHLAPTGRASATSRQQPPAITGAGPLRGEWV